MRVQRLGLWAIAFVLAACASSTTDVTPVSPSGFRHGSAVAVADPTVRPARVVPEAIESKKNYGIEAGQGPNTDAISRTSTRLLTAGFRVLVGSDGSVRTSADRFPSSPRETLTLPDRLGGGFLFVTDDTSRTSSIWRAERWTDPARRIAQWQEPIEKVMIGLDRVYVRTRNGLGAVDAVTGAALDRGALPTSPQVEDFVAEDAWRAVAIEDLRGVVATFDAGATWRVLDVPTRVSRIVPTRDGLVLGRTPAEPWFLLKRDGSVARLSSAPREVVRDDRARAGVDDETRANDASPPKSNATTSPFGTRPLTAAIEDGWPLEDGTAVVARDGALGRIRLDDGSLVESVEHAFPMPSSKCHAVTLARPTNPGAFGFVCGTYAGPTAIYAYDAKKGALVERKRFESPRVVVASGNGALVVKGRCASDPEPTNDAAQAKLPMEDTPTYCVGGVDDRWREIRLHGGVGSERVVALADGDVAILSPPSAKDAARLTLLRGTTVTNHPVTFTQPSKDLAHLLSLGVWLDGFEERRPGVLSGWIEVGGSVLGVEIGKDGKATEGTFIRDTGLTFVSGRYGLGWSKARESYETTDGGMTWQKVTLPDPIDTTAEGSRRACGPVGCAFAGWLRVGWGAPKTTEEPVKIAPVPPPKRRTLPSVQLLCESSDPEIPSPPPAARPMKTTPPPSTRPPVSPRPLTPPRRTGAWVGRTSPEERGTTSLPPFLSHAAPKIERSEVGREFKAGTFGRVYAWGPETGNWAAEGKWQIRWLPTFAGWQGIKSTAVTSPPSGMVDFLQPTMRSEGWGFDVLATDDATHALLGYRRQGYAAFDLFEIEEGRSPSAVRHVDGTPFSGFQEALFVGGAGGAWFVTTRSGSRNGDSAPSTLVWRIDGGVARELARVPRTSDSELPTHLAKRSNERAIGLVVDNASSASATQAAWVLPIDVETGRTSEIEALSTEPSEGPIEACSTDSDGWILETSRSVPLTISFQTPGAPGNGPVKSSAWMTPMTVRVRVDEHHTCLERASGRLGGSMTWRAKGFNKNPAKSGLSSNDVIVAATIGEARHELRCSVVAPTPTPPNAPTR